MRRQQTTGALLLTIAAAYLGIAWDGVVAALLFPAAALVGYGTVVLSSRLRLPVWLVAPGFVMAVTVGGAVLTASRTGSDALTAARDLVPRLLSMPYPAPATVDTLAPGVVVVAAVAVGCAIRVSRRAGGGLSPLVAVATLYLATAVLSGGRADPRGLVAGVLLAATVADWLIDEVARPSGADAPDEPAGRAATSAALRLAAVRSAPVLGLMAGVVVLTTYLPVAESFEPRRVVPRPTQLLAERHPLASMAAWNRDGGTEVMRLRAQRPTTVRLVALDEFTGDGWRAGGTYTTLGANALDPADEALPPGSRRATVDVEVTLAVGMEGHWLPTPGATEATSLADVLVQPASGALARLQPSRAGLRYRVRARVDAPRPADLAGATVPVGPDVARYLEVPRLPAQLAELARTTIQGARSPYERALRIEETVRGGRTLNPAAPVGSSYARIADLLAARGEGTAEQFASAFAVLARSAGLPTRVVVGFLPVDRDAQGYWVVRGRDAVVWPEVYFADLGWVPFDPRPGGSSGLLRPR